MQITIPQSIIHGIKVPPSLRCLPRLYCLHSSSYSSQDTPSCDSFINQSAQTHSCQCSREWSTDRYYAYVIVTWFSKPELAHAQKMTSGRCPRQQLTPSPRALVGWVCGRCITVSLRRTATDSLITLLKMQRVSSAAEGAKEDVEFLREQGGCTASGPPTLLPVWRVWGPDYTVWHAAHHWLWWLALLILSQYSGWVLFSVSIKRNTCLWIQKMGYEGVVVVFKNTPLKFSMFRMKSLVTHSTM